ncbi:MAG: ComEC/Rec2 family competence protein, partial [Cyclobacteriaceae bacterium]
MAHIPLARIAIPLIAGIIISLLFEVAINNLFFFSACVALIATASILHRIHLNYNHRWLFGLLISLFFVFVGIKLCEQHKQLNRSNHFGNYAHSEGSALIRITEPVSEKENSFMLKGVVNSIFYNDTIIDVNGNIILYMQKDDKVSELNYGDIIITENNFQRVNPSSNPHEFNYKKFLEYNNIFHQSYRRSEEWMHTGINNGNFLLKKAHQIRNIALEIFQNNNISGKEYAVVSALVLGHRDYLDDEL